MTVTSIPFEHKQTGDCEIWRHAALLRERGTVLSEAMVFRYWRGLTSPICPFVKLGASAHFVSHCRTKYHARREQRLGIRMQYDTFNTVDAGMRALDEKLGGSRGGLQTPYSCCRIFHPTCVSISMLTIWWCMPARDTYLIATRC